MFSILEKLSCMTILAQEKDVSGERNLLFVTLGGFLLLVIVFAIILSVIRKKWLNEQKPEASDPFSISDLKRLYREGQLTEEEFEKAKAQIISLHTPELDERKTGDSVDKAAGDTDNQQ